MKQNKIFIIVRIDEVEWDFNDWSPNVFEYHYFILMKMQSRDWKAEWTIPKINTHTIKLN